MESLCENVANMNLNNKPAPKKRITKGKAASTEPIVAAEPTVASEPVVAEEPAGKKKRASKPKHKEVMEPVPEPVVPPVPEALPNKEVGRWHTYTLDFQRILQSFFVEDGRYVGLMETAATTVEPVFFVACSSQWTEAGELPVIFVASTTRTDEAGIDHFEPSWENPRGDGLLTVAAMYNCMPFDAKRDYVRA